jgi:hypothetical protein
MNAISNGSNNAMRVNYGYSLARLTAPILVVTLGANRILRSIRVDAFFGSMC